MKLSAKDRTKLFERIMERAEGCCEYCHGNQNLDAHHIIYRSQGGLWTGENMIILCRECHNRAHGVQQPKITREELFKIIGGENE